MPTTPSTCCRLLLADDHAIVRDGLRSFLEDEGFEVVGEASDGLEAVRLCRELRPPVAVLDISMPSLNGIDATREVMTKSPDTHVILLTMHSGERSALAGLRAGAKGYVLKTKAASSLIDAIQAVCKGEIYLSPGVPRSVLEAYLAKDNSRVDPLSTRERQVLQLIAEGKNMKEIGAILEISAKTAEVHRAHIMHKLDIHDVAGLVRYAVWDGLVHVDER